MSSQYTTRRASSVATRPALTQRTATSSSAGPAMPQRRPSIPIRPSTRSHRDSTTSFRSSRSRRDSSMTEPGDFNAFTEDEYSLEDEEWERGGMVGDSKNRRKKDEPMSPVAVVLYVVFFYIIWQILTRSDETEILGHLPLNHLQSLSSSLHSDLRPQSQQYHLPYHLPQIPSPIPNTQTESTSTFRTILGVIVYPVYLVITLIATPFPLLLNALHLIAHVIGTVLYPLTATCKVLGRTLVLAPLGVISSILAVFYPVYVFVGGVVGVGCVLGVGVGWVGKMVLDTMFGNKKKRKAANAKGGRTAGVGRSSSGRGRTESARSTVSRTQSRRGRAKALSPSTEEDGEQLQTPVSRSVPIIPDEEDYAHQTFHEDLAERTKRHRQSINRGHDRDAAASGLRRRGVRDSWLERD